MFFYAPNDADQGFIQKIFYLHVPLAIVALFGFVAGGVYGIRYLRTRRPAARPALLRRDPPVADPRRRRAGHRLDLGARVLGHWWEWDEPTLVSFLIVFLLYACYQPLRFSIEDPERQARYAAVFAIVAGAFVPLNFIAVRMAETLVHPRVLADDRRRDAGRDAADVPRLARGHGVPVRDAVEVRAGLQARAFRLRALQAQARRRGRAGPRTRAARRRRSC